ncbi:nucleotidyltransferase family protein [Candidatus Acetothermia bacterium]|nr:nucleotidyltransferase family protein [Candidatus Acetothermia bacterium]
MTKNVTRITARLKKNLPLLSQKYHVKNLKLFGSYVQGQQKKGSDLDILIEFSKPIDLFTFVELKDFLSELLGVKVDLVMKDTLKPRIKEKILREALSVEVRR